MSTLAPSEVVVVSSRENVSVRSYPSPATRRTSTHCVESGISVRVAGKGGSISAAVGVRVREGKMIMWDSSSREGVINIIMR